MGTTETGLRFPVGTDKVVDGDDAIRALAEDVTHASWSGVTANVLVPISGTANAAITFPAGWFTRAPVVTAAATNSAVFAVIGGPGTTTGVTITLRNISSATGQNSTANVLAMLPPGAPVGFAAAAELGVAALADDGTLTYIVTCQTDGCPMFGVPIEVLTWADNPLTNATCGTCGREAAFEETGAPEEEL